MIRRQLTADGSILIRSSLRTELHAEDGTLVEGRNATAAERAAHEAWEATADRVTMATLTRPSDAESERA